jgi:hypothetical protein
MLVPVPRSLTTPSLLVLVASLCMLVGAGSAAALAQEPDPGPLWKAYPLNPGKSGAGGAKSTERPNGAPLSLDQTPPPRGGAGVRTKTDRATLTNVPLAVSIAFYVALAMLSALAAGSATLWFVRRRAARPIVCKITWSPDEEGDAFLATAQREGEGEWVVARSGRFDRAADELPEYDAASHAAYDQLLNELYADGWQPYERGRQWWEMRLRRNGPSATPTPSRDG